jgi:hypothetical protein
VAAPTLNSSKPRNKSAKASPRRANRCNTTACRPGPFGFDSCRGNLRNSGIHRAGPAARRPRASRFREPRFRKPRLHKRIRAATRRRYRGPTAPLARPRTHDPTRSKTAPQSQAQVTLQIKTAPASRTPSRKSGACAGRSRRTHPTRAPCPQMFHLQPSPPRIYRGSVSAVAQS